MGNKPLNVLLSGEIPDNNFYVRQFDDAISSGRSVIVFDYKNNIHYEKSLELTLAEFIPFLNNKECSEIFASFFKANNEKAAFIKRFIHYFSYYSNRTGVGLFDDWSMMGLLNDSINKNCPSLHNFLDDNFNNLADLENSVKYIVDSIGTPKYDLANSLNKNKVFIIKNQILGQSIYDKDIIKLVFNCLEEFLNLNSSELFINGMSNDVFPLLSDFISRTSIAKTSIVDDVFSLDKTIQNALFSNTKKVIFFKHRDYNSCQAIADYIGKEERPQISVNRYPDSVLSFGRRLLNRAINFTKDISVVGTDRFNTGYSISKIDKYRIRPDEIMSLNSDHCIVVNTNDGTYKISKF